LEESAADELKSVETPFVGYDRLTHSSGIIAIVIDDKVFYTPVVKTPMEKGLCEITGNFTQEEVNYFLALVNNELLPMELILK